MSRCRERLGMYGSDDSSEAGTDGADLASERGGDDSGDASVDLREVVVEHRAEIFRYARSFTPQRRRRRGPRPDRGGAGAGSGRRVCATPSRRSGTCCASCATSPPTRRAPAPGSSVEPWADVPDSSRSPSSHPTTIVAPRRRATRVPRAAFADLARVTARCCGCASSRSSTTTTVAERLAHDRARRAPARVPRDAGAPRASPPQAAP